MEVGGYFRAVIIAQALQRAACRYICQDGMRAKERQGKSQIAGKRREALQQGDIADAAPGGGVAPGEQAFFFHVEADDDAHGCRSGIHAVSVDTAVANGKGEILPKRA